MWIWFYFVGKGAFTPRSCTVAYWVRNCTQLHADEYTTVRGFFANSTRESTHKINDLIFSAYWTWNHKTAKVHGEFATARNCTRTNTQLYTIICNCTELYAVYCFSSLLLIGCFDFIFAYLFWIKNCYNNNENISVYNINDFTWIKWQYK